MNNTEFKIVPKEVQIGVDLLSTNYSLYKGDLYVAKISRPFLPDEDEKTHIVFDVLGECAETAYCEPHEVLRPANHEALHALNEYLGDRKTLKNKSGWCTKTQYWHTYTLEANEFEQIVV